MMQFILQRVRLYVKINIVDMLENQKQLPILVHVIIMLVITVDL